MISLVSAPTNLGLRPPEPGAVSGTSKAPEALRATGGGGLVHVDGHTDFRHPGNSDAHGSLAGEDLAAAVGRHLPEVADIEGRGPYVHPQRAVHLGCRQDDEDAAEARALLADVIPAARTPAASTRIS